MSFIADKIVLEGLTFDDLLLVPSYSQVLPRDVSLETKFSRNITLNVPMVSAAMDTVTETVMAIAIAVYIGATSVILGSAYAEKMKSQVDPEIRTSSSLGVLASYLRTAGTFGIGTIVISTMETAENSV